MVRTLRSQKPFMKEDAGKGSDACKVFLVQVQRIYSSSSP